MRLDLSMQVPIGVGATRPTPRDGHRVTCDVDRDTPIVTDYAEIELKVRR